MYTMKLYVDYAGISHLLKPRLSSESGNKKKPVVYNWTHIHRSIKLHPGIAGLRKIPPLPYYSPYFPEYVKAAPTKKKPVRPFGVSFYPPYRTRTPHPYASTPAQYLKRTQPNLRRCVSDPGRKKPAGPRRRNEHLERRYSFAGVGRRFSEFLPRTNSYKDSTKSNNKNTTISNRNNQKHGCRGGSGYTLRIGTAATPKTPRITSRQSITSIMVEPPSSSINSRNGSICTTNSEISTLATDVDDSIYNAEPVYAMLPGPQPQKRMPWDIRTGTELNTDLTPLYATSSWSDEQHGISPKKHSRHIRWSDEDYGIPPRQKSQSKCWSDEDYGMPLQQKSRRRQLVNRAFSKVHRVLEKVLCVRPLSQ